MRGIQQRVDVVYDCEHLADGGPLLGEKMQGLARWVGQSLRYFEGGMVCVDCRMLPSSIWWVGPPGRRVNFVFLNSLIAVALLLSCPSHVRVLGTCSRSCLYPPHASSLANVFSDFFVNVCLLLLVSSSCRQQRRRRRWRRRRGVRSLRDLRAGVLFPWEFYSCNLVQKKT